jgi:hypothetical protein
MHAMLDGLDRLMLRIGRWLAKHGGVGRKIGCYKKEVYFVI